jgi:hypothetical protein
MKTPRLAQHCAVLLAACATLSLAHAGVVDNFESYTPGTFPSATWLDAASFAPNPPGFPVVTVPSATVVSTTDAHGAATQALQLADSLGSARGIYTVDGVSTMKTVQADVRVLRYSDGNPAVVAPVLDSPFTIGFLDANPAASPFATLYIASTTHTWHIFYDGVFASDPAGDDLDTGLTAELEHWYTASFSYDTMNRSFAARVLDTATGLVLRLATVQYADNGLADHFDGTFLWGLEASATIPPGPGQATRANIAQFDNVNVTSVPEPASAALAMAALLALRLTRRLRA